MRKSLMCKGIGEYRAITLTTGTDTFVGTSGNDTVTGDSTTLGAADLILDQSSTDNDTLNVTLTAKNLQATVTGIENVNFAWNAFGFADIDATKITGATITGTSEKVGFLGNMTVTAAGANTVVAGSGMDGVLTVNGVTAATVDAGVATSVLAQGTAATTDTVTVTAGADTTAITIGSVTAIETVTATASAATTTVTATGYKTATIDAANATTVTLTGAAASSAATVTLGATATVNNTLGEVTLNIADGKTVTLVDAAIAEDVTVTGAGNVTLKSATLDGATVLNEKTAGTLTVESTLAGGSVDLTDVEADLFKLATATATGATVKSGANVEVGVDLGAGVFRLATDSDADVINVTFTKSQATSTTFADATPSDFETVNIVAAATQATSPAVTDLTFASLVAAGNTVNLSGTNDVQVTSLNAKVLDAANLNGELVVSGTAAAATDVTVAGAQGKNDVTISATAVKAAFIGQSAADKVNFGTLAAAAEATAVTVDGNDTVIANLTSLATGSLSVETGAGDDVVELTGDAATAGTVVLQFGDGSDTLKLANTTDLSDTTNLNLTVTGLEKIQITTAVTVAAEFVSGEAYVVTSTGGAATDKLTIEGTVAAGETINLSSLVVTDSVTSGITTVVTGNAGADTITGTSVIDEITAGAGADSITGGAGADVFVIGDTDSGITVATADTITDFVSGSDTLKLGVAGVAVGTGVSDSYAEATTAVADFAAALAAANTTLAALKVSETTPPAEFYSFQFDATNGYLFEDTDADGDADQVIILVGIDNTEIAAADIVA